MITLALIVCALLTIGLSFFAGMQLAKQDEHAELRMRNEALEISVEMLTQQVKLYRGSYHCPDNWRR